MDNEDAAVRRELLDCLTVFRRRYCMCEDLINYTITIIGFGSPSGGATDEKLKMSWCGEVCKSIKQT